MSGESVNIDVCRLKVQFTFTNSKDITESGGGQCF